jgi:hypothetical protein
VKLLVARAFDPFHPELGEALQENVRRAEWEAALPDPLEGAREEIILVDAEALLADERLLADYASFVAGREDITLAIDASRMPEQAASAQLTALVERCGLAGSNEVDMIAVVGELDPSQRRGITRRTTALSELLASAIRQ